MQDQIAELPNIEGHIKVWFSEAELMEVGNLSVREELELHDPQNHV